MALDTSDLSLNYSTTPQYNDYSDENKDGLSSSLSSDSSIEGFLLRQIKEIVKEVHGELFKI